MNPSDPEPPQGTADVAAVEAVEAVEVLVGPQPDTPVVGQLRKPRLARHQIRLSDGHQVGVMVAGRGVPLVVIHGFTAEGFLYAQTLSRLVGMGFKVIAIDTAGHGGTAGLSVGGANIHSYAELLGRVLDELGIRRCVLAGHSMGGRLVTQEAALQPTRAIAVVLVDAIVGDTWDRMVYLFRIWPPLLGAVGAALAVDSLFIPPVLRNPPQAVKLLRLVVPTLAAHALQPWRLLGPMVSILRTRSSRYALDAAHEAGVPFFVLHGDRDYAVPMRTAEDTVRRVDGHLVRVQGAGHSWLLRDPETLPAIVSMLRKNGLGEAIAEAAREAGLDPETATRADLEEAFLAPGSLVAALTPEHSLEHAEIDEHRPIYRWTDQPGR